MAKPRTPTIFTSPQDAAMAFYQAFEAKDVDAMMAPDFWEIGASGNRYDRELVLPVAVEAKARSLDRRRGVEPVAITKPSASSRRA